MSSGMALFDRPYKIITSIFCTVSKILGYNCGVYACHVEKFCIFATAIKLLAIYVF